MSGVPGRVPAAQFTISFGGEIDLEASTQIWPDGDGPDAPTAGDVVEVIKQYGPVWSWLTEWNLGDSLTVDVLGVDGDRKRVDW